ncbi:hypothetical protein SKAU_G00107970 [Synaphobranchus kaupii]|uniref:Uncharacterized protein n=1 Tax=Synaphobranchus kaupii TaxID=118154 RepID=A0A9Q1G0J7_SYNKA|nr:hypothetical protein SKAU_G00107970 [Synaphobranchus kaupii]
MFLGFPCWRVRSKVRGESVRGPTTSTGWDHTHVGYHFLHIVESGTAMGQDRPWISMWLRRVSLGREELIADGADLPLLCVGGAKNGSASFLNRGHSGSSSCTREGSDPGLSVEEEDEEEIPDCKLRPSTNPTTPGLRTLPPGRCCLTVCDCCGTETCALPGKVMRTC